MKRIVFTLLLISIPWIMNCQEWQYSSVINGTNIEPRYSTIDAQGNVYILSFFSGSITDPAITSYGIGDLFLCKMSPTGTLLWYDRIGGTGNDLPGGMNIADGFLYVSGGFNNTCNFNGGASQLTSAGITDMFLAKYSLNGEFQYARIVGTFPTVQVTLHIKADNNHQLVMTGYFRDSVKIGYTGTPQKIIKGTPGIVSNFIALLDLEGNCIWAKSILGTHTDTRFQRIGISENGYYFGGFLKGDLTFDLGTISSYAATTFDAFIYKTDFDGNGQWIRRISGTNTENFRTLTTDEYDNVYVLGNFNSATIYVDSTSALTQSYEKSAGPNYDTYMAKFNRSGILQWFLIKGGTGKDIYNDFVIRNNVIYATGYFADQIIFNNDTLHTDNTLNEDAFLAAFNQIGDPISGISINGTGNYDDAGYIVRMDANSRAYVAGYFRSPQIQIGSQIYTSGDVNASDQFFAVYKQPFKAVITAKRQISCFGLSDGMLTVTPYFGRPPYTYVWSHNPGLNNPVADNLAPGTYTVTITDANDSITGISGVITQSAQLAIGSIITPVSCIGMSDGAIDITVTGGKIKNNYVYNWSSPDGSGIDPRAEDQTGLTAETYTVVVNDDNNCSDSADLLVIQPEPFNYAGSKVIPINGTTWSVDLAVSGGNSPFNFSWTGPGSFTATTEDLSGLTAGGLYSVSLTDDKNCISDTSFAVNDGTTMIAQITSKTDVTCNGLTNGSATVTVVNGLPPYSYAWTGPMALPSVANPSGLMPGTYYVTVSDATLPTAHTAIASVVIIEPSAPLSLVLNPDNLRCNGDNSGVLDLIVAGGTTPYRFLWNTNHTGEDLVNVPAGLYSVTVTDANNCTAQGNNTLTEPLPIALDISIDSDIPCNGGNSASLTANASGGSGSFSYLWNDPGTQVTKTAFELFAGNYQVSVTDENGCIKTASTLILQPDSLSIDAVLNDPCPGASNGSIVPVVTGGTPSYDYVWSNNFYERINTNLAAGTYTLTVTDSKNCSLVQEFTLTNSDTVKIVSVVPTNLTCSGLPDGSLTVTATGGSGIYEYSTDGGVTYVNTSTIGSLAEGDYIIMVQDDKNCLSGDFPITLLKDETCALIIYDAFSPNADGKNDVWNIGNIDNLPSCSVKIFNLWGIMVFSSKGYGTPWDGVYKGKYLPAGTYYYVIDPGDGSDVLSGPVSIVK